MDDVAESTIRDGANSTTKQARVSWPFVIFIDVAVFLGFFLRDVVRYAEVTDPLGIESTWEFGRVGLADYLDAAAIGTLNALISFPVIWTLAAVSRAIRTRLFKGAETHSPAVEVDGSAAGQAATASSKEGSRGWVFIAAIVVLALAASNGALWVSLMNETERREEAELRASIVDSEAAVSLAEVEEMLDLISDSCARLVTSGARPRPISPSQRSSELRRAACVEDLTELNNCVNNNFMLLAEVHARVNDPADQLTFC